MSRGCPLDPEREEEQKSALAACLPAPDDAQVVELAGHPVSVVESDLTNLKITTKPDMTLAAAILKARPVPVKKTMRPFEEAQW